MVYPGSILVDKPKNVVMHLLYSEKIDDHVVTDILVAISRSGKFVFPGGGVDVTDADSLSAIKREFREETGNDLPNILNLHHYKYKYDTLMYVGHINKETRNKIKFKRGTKRVERELIGLRWIPLPIALAASRAGVFKFRSLHEFYDAHPEWFT